MRPNMAEPTVRAVLIAQELVNLPTQTDRQMRIHSEYLRYAQHPELAVIFSVSLNLAVLAMLDNAVSLAGRPVTYDANQASRAVKRSLRKRGRK